MGEATTIYADTTAKIDYVTSGLPVRVFSKEFLTTYCVLVASFGSFCNGMFVGWSSHATLRLDDTYSTDNVARIASYLALGAAISPLVANKLWYAIGTKSSVLFSCLIMSTSVIGLYINYGLFFLLASRFTSGLAVGVIHLLMLLYVHDVAAKSTTATDDAATLTTTAIHISRLNQPSSVFHLQFVLGVLTMYISGLLDFPHLSCVLLVTASVAFTIGVCLLPESPRFLCYKEREEEARDVISMFTEIDATIERKLMLWSEQEDVRAQGFLGLFDRKSLPSRKIVTAFALVVLQQLMGITSIMFYMEKVLSLTYGEYPADVTAIFCMAIFAVAIIVRSVYAIPVDDKSLLVWSTALLGIILCAFGVHCHYRGTIGYYADDPNQLLPLYMFGAALTVYAFGPMRLVDHFVQKSVPSNSYFTYMSLLVSVNWLTIFGVTRVLPTLINTIGIGWMLWYMMIICVMATIFFSCALSTDKANTIQLVDEEKLVGGGVAFVSDSNSSTRPCSEHGFV